MESELVADPLPKLAHRRLPPLSVRDIRYLFTTSVSALTALQPGERQ